MTIQSRFSLAMTSVGVSLVVLATIVIWKGAGNGYGSTDTKEWLLSAAFGHRTRFGEKFSERAFKKIRFGMTRDEVLAVLGEPIERCFPGEPDKLWRFAGPAKGSSNFHQRDIWFSTHGTVAGIVKRFYWD